ncbi:MAG: hypothetical protein JRI72_08600, partial [Deltaproteobacteria bacterium]|nr:hypothetical protein [Deltaproteobacteria bacterium]
MKTKKGRLYTKLSIFLFISILILTLTACFSDDQPPTGGTTTTTTTISGGTTTTTIAGVQTIGTVTVSAGSNSIVADGASISRITATVKDTSGYNMADGTTVTFDTTAGTLSAASATTASGLATVTLTSATNLGSATIRGTSDGVSGTATVTFIAGAPAAVTFTATPASLTADGTSTSTIDVTVLDANSNPVADGETLSFSALYGTLDNLLATITGGRASVTYTAPNYVPASGNDTITVQAANGQSGTAVITLIGPQIATISLSANPTSLPADGSSQATITATVTVVGGGNAPDGTTVNFSITQGGGSITATATTAGGAAIATLTSGSTAETATIQVVAGGITAEIQVEYTPGSVTLTIVPNSLLGTGQETATVTATLKDAAGSSAPDGETVNFTLDDLSLGSITSSALTSGGQGEATVTFQAAAKGGTVTVTATWNTGGVDVTGTETITIQPPPAYIEIAAGSPNPASINIKGTGGQSTSQIIFDVKDTQGALVADGYRIDFSIAASPDGGEEISPLFATTVSGQVSTILRSGYKSGPVSIKATYFYDTNISSTTGQISIVNGPPVGEEFGMRAQYLNISGLWKHGLIDQITVSANDIYGNAIPDNTSISFKTYKTGGDFDPGSSLTSGGLATSNLISGPPDPLSGFVSLTTEAVNGGRTTHVTSLAVTPLDNNIIYAGTDGGGVYKSTDSGATWENISRSSTEQGQNWIDPYVNDIAVDPDDLNTVYAATGYLGKGNVYRSLDGGLNWNSNNVEEWNGILSINTAVLTVLCDDATSDYVWVGTEGLGAVYASDGETFQWGGIISTPPTPDPGNTGNGTMSTPTLSSTTKTETWTATHVIPSASATVPAAGDDNVGNGTMTNVTTDPSATVTETWTVTYTGEAGAVTYAGTQANPGTLVDIAVVDAVSENWTVKCIDATADAEIFSVHGSLSGYQLNAQMTSAQYVAYTTGAVTFKIIRGTDAFTVNDQFTFPTTTEWQVSGSVSGAQSNPATTTVAYTSDSGQVVFTISAGSIPFKVADQFTFNTTAAAIPYWNVEGTVSGSQVNKAYNGTAYSSDNAEATFTVTEGGIAFAEGDEFTFAVTESGLGYGKTVRDIVKVPGTNGNTAILYAATATGVFKSTDGGQTWTETTSFTGDHITTLALHPTFPTVIYAGTEDAGVWVSIDSGTTWTNYTGGMGRGLSASTPFADTDNTGNGVMSAVTVEDNAESEYWEVRCITAAADGGTFSVTGTVSGAQASYDITAGTYSIANVLSFTIIDGATDFAVGDTFTFSTTRDPGKTIKDLLVDQGNNRLYAITYFWGPLEPHAVGNVYVHALNAGDGDMAAGNWTEANTNLP